MSVQNIQGGRAAGAAFGGVSTKGTMAMLSPESLVALCAMQLKKFDEDILTRMSEKDRNIDIQQKLALLTSKLEDLKESGLSVDNSKTREGLIKDMESLIETIGEDVNKKDLRAHLGEQVKALKNGNSPSNYPGFKAEFDKKAEDRHKKYSKLEGDNLKHAQGVAHNAINWKTGKVDESKLTGLDQNIQDAVRARADEHKAWLDLEGARVGKGTLSKEQVNGLLEYTKAAGASISSRNDTIMMELQSLVSQRSTSIQMTSNLTNSLLESAKTIAGNIGR